MQERVKIMDKISIIVPVYNVKNYIDRVINCLINQTYHNLEIILVDDGSTDGSSKLCDKYKKKDNRIKVIHQKNSGVSVARNVGLKHATGEYIGFVDSDDYISLNMYEELYNNLISTNSDISVCSYLTFKDKLPNFNVEGNIKIFDTIDALKDIISDGVITNFLWNKLFKREIFENISFPEGKIYEDLYVMPKLIDNASIICFDSKKLYAYYQRNDSYVNSYSLDKNNNYLEFCDYCYQYLSKYDVLREARESYRCFYIYTAFLQSSKVGRLDIINSDKMKEEYKFFCKSFRHFNKNNSFKKRFLYYLLYFSKKLFYMFVVVYSDVRLKWHKE